MRAKDRERAQVAGVLRLTNRGKIQVSSRRSQWRGTGAICHSLVERGGAQSETDPRCLPRRSPRKVPDPYVIVPRNSREITVKEQSLRLSLLAAATIVVGGLLGSGTSGLAQSGDGAAIRHSDDGSCSNRTLRGKYAFTIEGFFVDAPVPLPLRGIAMTQFDGRGHLTQVDHVVFNGMLPPVEWTAATGTYTASIGIVMERPRLSFLAPRFPLWSCASSSATTGPKSAPLFRSLDTLSAALPRRWTNRSEWPGVSWGRGLRMTEATPLFEQP